MKKRLEAACEERAAEALKDLGREIERLTDGQERRMIDVAGITVVRRIRPTTPSCLTYEPSVALIVQGWKRVQLGTQSLRYGAGEYLLTAVNLPIVSQIPQASQGKPFVAMAIPLQMAVVRELLSEWDGPVGDREVDRPGMTVGVASWELLDACRRLLGLAGKPQEIAVLAGHTVREIVFRLLQGPAAGRLRAMATEGKASHRLGRAVDWIREHYEEPLRVEYLAGLAGMAISTFHHHFRELTAMSPLQYQKRIRLQAARELMIGSGMDAAQAGYAVGYESASQFHREFRRMFGESPLQEVRKILERRGED